MLKPDVDPPHSRPHEPFEDRNFNGYWDDDPTMEEHWLDINENGEFVNKPDLPGVEKAEEMNFAMASKPIVHFMSTKMKKYKSR